MITIKLDYNSDNETDQNLAKFEEFVSSFFMDCYLLIFIDNRLEIGQGYLFYCDFYLKFGKIWIIMEYNFFLFVWNLAKFTEISRNATLQNWPKFTETDRNYAKQILSFSANPSFIPLIKHIKHNFPGPAAKTLMKR